MIGIILARKRLQVNDVVGLLSIRDDYLRSFARKSGATLLRSRCRCSDCKRQVDGTDLLTAPVKHAEPQRVGSWLQFQLLMGGKPGLHDLLVDGGKEISFHCVGGITGGLKISV